MKNFKPFHFLILLLSFPIFVSCQAKINSDSNLKNNDSVIENNLEKATFGAGCFWCIEAAYDQLKGVHKVQSGYAGGHVIRPSYKEVCTGNTGHAEVVQISYDPSVISYGTLLEVFWTLHDPTQLNRQGNDVGTQYRSEIFYHDENQRIEAEKSLEEQKKSGHYAQPIVTKISALNDNFYPAEDYHTDYYELNQTQPYCSAVVAPKLQKFSEKFRVLLKD